MFSGRLDHFGLVKVHHSFLFLLFMAATCVRVSLFGVIFARFCTGFSIIGNDALGMVQYCVTLPAKANIFLIHATHVTTICTSSVAFIRRSTSTILYSTSRLCFVI